jgi:hypothetical protein
MDELTLEQYENPGPFDFEPDRFVPHPDQRPKKLQLYFHEY